MIEIRNLVKRYGDTTAVNGISFAFETGKIYGFLGPNGAGKSTTLNIMTGYLSPTEGKVLVDGEDILEKPEKTKKKIGYLPEVPPLYAEQTVREYLNFSAALKSVPHRSRRQEVERVMDLCRLRQAEKKLTSNLSKGFRQRVGLAQALIGMPEIIILDEPSAGLDPKQAVEMREMIANLRSGHTVILSSHILSEVSAVCDEVVIIAGGRLVASGTLESLGAERSKDKYLSLAVRGSREQIENRIRGLVPKFRFTIHSWKEPGSYEAIINVPADSDCRESLFFGMAEAHLPILAMSEEELSLEDVFLQLTGGSGKTRKGA